MSVERELPYSLLVLSFYILMIQRSLLKFISNVHKQSLLDVIGLVVVVVEREHELPAIEEVVVVGIVEFEVMEL